MSTANPKVDLYLKRAKKFREEMTLLREILREFPLEEELKWGKPCYTLGGGNVVVIVGFTKYCSLIFAKGALVKDPQKILVRPSENTQAARQARFTSVAEVEKLKPVVKACIQSAIDVQKSGAEVKYKTISEVALPGELQAQLDKSAPFKTAFNKLTPGRQRAYILHFSAAKQAATRLARIEKAKPMILAGKGLHDEYRSGR